MSDHEPEPTGYPKHDRTCLLSIHDAPEGSMPCTCGASERDESPAQPSEED